MTAVHGRYTKQGRGQRATTAGGGAERTCGGNSDASSASGAPSCASHRMRQRIPEQRARGAPTTAAVGYCSVLCGNGTAALPDS
jgi:hypothetical protein